MFRQDRMDFCRNNMVSWLASQDVPVALMGDFNSDGKMDFLLPGASCYYGWWPAKTVAFENVGEGNFKSHGGYKWDAENPNYEYETEQVPVYKKDDEGNIIYENGEPVQDTNEDGSLKFETVTKTDGEGNPILKLGDDGKPIISGYPRLDLDDEFGALPVFSRNWDSMPIDYNQDGLLDYIVMNGSGGNIQDNNYQQQHAGIFILENVGDFHFKKVYFDAFDMYLDDNNVWGDGLNQNNKRGSVAVGDYDRDGYPDFIVQASHWNGNQPRRGNVTLFHNEKGKGFTIADVFDPLPLEKEYNISGLYEKTEDTVDPDDPDVIIKGVYDVTKPTCVPQRSRHGQVVMADFNNDGWLDIVVAGYADGDENSEDPHNDMLAGKYIFRLYQNTKDGRFQDVTDTMIPMAGIALEAAGREVTGTIKDVMDAYAFENGYLVPVDWDQNGTMDLFCNFDGRGKRLSIVLLGQEEGTLFKEEIASGFPSVSDCSSRTGWFADMNGDDVMDLMMFGWSQYNRTDATASEFNNWSSAYIGSNGTPGSYTFINAEDGERPEEEKFDNGYSRNDDTMVFGDLDGDGLIDGFYNFWDSEWQPDATGKNCNDRIGVNWNACTTKPVAPGVPENLMATEVAGADGQILVEWDASMLKTGKSAMYNLYIKNQQTNQTFMLVPADMKSGAQLSYLPFGGYVSAGSESFPEYTYVNIPNGTYEIGVQAVSPSYLASEFATTTVEVKNSTYTGVKKVDAAVTMNVTVDGNAITVKSNKAAGVEIYAISGARVAAGRTNEPIAVNGKGVFIVKAHGKSVKVVK